MKITKVILLLLLMVSLLGTEVHTMAIKSDVNVPAWLKGNVSPAAGGGNNKNSNQLANAGNKSYGKDVQVLVNQSNKQPKKKDQLRDAPPEMPSWMQAAVGAATGAAINNPVVASAAMGGYATDLSNQNVKGFDTLRGNTHPMDGLQRHGIPLGSGEAPGNTMSDYLRSLYADPSYDPTNPAYTPPSGGYPRRGFGSRYGDNWGGGGGGGGWGGGGGGYSDTPAWLANMYLNSWNIR